MSKNYEINEKDINTAPNILKKTNPENATFEKTIEFIGNILVASYEIKKIKGTGV